MASHSTAWLGCIDESESRLRRYVAAGGFFAAAVGRGAATITRGDDTALVGRGGDAGTAALTGDCSAGDAVRADVERAEDGSTASDSHSTSGSSKSKPRANLVATAPDPRAAAALVREPASRARCWCSAALSRQRRHARTPAARIATAPTMMPTSMPMRAPPPPPPSSLASDVAAEPFTGGVAVVLVLRAEAFAVEFGRRVGGERLVEASSVGTVEGVVVARAVVACGRAGAVVVATGGRAVVAVGGAVRGGGVGGGGSVASAVALVAGGAGGGGGAVTIVADGGDVVSAEGIVVVAGASAGCGVPALVVVVAAATMLVVVVVGIATTVESARDVASVERGRATHAVPVHEQLVKATHAVRVGCAAQSGALSTQRVGTKSVKAVGKVRTTSTSSATSRTSQRLVGHAATSTPNVAHARRHSRPTSTHAASKPHGMFALDALGIAAEPQPKHTPPRCSVGQSWQPSPCPSTVVHWVAERAVQGAVSQRGPVARPPCVGGSAFQ